jgi:hypothetical protein
MAATAPLKHLRFFSRCTKPRTPNAIRQARFRSRQKHDALYVEGDVPRVVVENLIALEWLKPGEAEDRQAIMEAMVAMLLTIK